MADTSTDGLDNDCNGATDCADSACAGRAPDAFGPSARSRVILPVANGYLVGFDRGEWGGGVLLFARGAKPRRVASGNTDYLVRLTPHRVLALGGPAVARGAFRRAA